ncbi:glucose-6-phosphate isomerase [Novipirellula rosea]|uniref:Glucose-6-phosphate isomerase n=1 Tax=Novipirellula rosea TaxID=1031540 RepID=A0ABP8N174_9BACT
MSLLRFDASRAFSADLGHDQTQYGKTLGEADSLRPEILEMPFFRLPAQQLADYVAIREESEVGRIFKIANSIHDKIDAVVVLGSDAATAGPIALRDACCDPYHNELCRAGRGSRPRMYFVGNHLDSDSIGALLNRLRSGGYGETAPETRWALVVIDPTGQTRETSVVLPHFITALKASLQRSPGESLGDYLIPITGESGPLRQFALANGCREIYDQHPQIAESHSIFTAAGLMPAAMLALDCMKLLEGAVAMNEHFKIAAPEENWVMQYVAASRGANRTSRIICLWTEALASVARWYTQIVDEPLASTVVSHPSGLLRQLESSESLPTSSLPDASSLPTDRPVIHHWSTAKWRMDPLSSPKFMHDDEPAEFSDAAPTATIPHLLADMIATSCEAVHQRGYRTTSFDLPHIDTFTLGQLFQMLMISTAIETGCRKIAASAV